jgi:hypothetical protein
LVDVGFEPGTTACTPESSFLIPVIHSPPLINLFKISFLTSALLKSKRQYLFKVEDTNENIYLKGQLHEIFDPRFFFIDRFNRGH